MKFVTIRVSTRLLHTTRVTQRNGIADKSQGVVLERTAKWFGRMLKCSAASIDRQRIIFTTGRRARVINAARTIDQQSAGDARLCVLQRREWCNTRQVRSYSQFNFRVLFSRHPGVDVVGHHKGLIWPHFNALMAAVIAAAFAGQYQLRRRDDGQLLALQPCIHAHDLRANGICVARRRAPRSGTLLLEHCLQIGRYRFCHSQT